MVAVADNSLVALTDVSLVVTEVGTVVTVTDASSVGVVVTTGETMDVVDVVGVTDTSVVVASVAVVDVVVPVLSGSVASTSSHAVSLSPSPHFSLGSPLQFMLQSSNGAAPLSPKNS